MTLTIKPGDWAVLREGTIEGPMVVKEDTKRTMYPVETGSSCTRSWTIDGKYYHPSETIAVEDDALDIIATLPCSPLERIRQLEEALRETIEMYGNKGGPWNVPSDPGGWISRARRALGKSK